MKELNNNTYFDTVIVFKFRHLHLLKLAIEGLNKYTPVRNIILITQKKNFRYSSNLASNLTLVDEDCLIPSMTLSDLKELPIYGFPKMAGWYYQQLLKLGAAFLENISENYLLWDADTVLLKRLTFFDKKGRVFLTKATEYHKPYFNLYRKLFGHDPNREFSFIAQHMMVSKEIVKTMLKKIENRIPGNETWAWKIMKSLDGKNERLSEYELYGLYIKKYFPNSVSFRDISWLREGSETTSFFPKSTDLEVLAKDYYYASFEYRPHNIIDKIILRSKVFYYFFKKQLIHLK